MNILENFNEFVNKNQKGILHIEQDDSEFNENWLLEINISNIWNDFETNNITLVDFNNQYASTLMEYQQQISETCGDACWNEIEPIVAHELRKSIDKEKSETIYNKLYDIFDQYEIFLKT